MGGTSCGGGVWFYYTSSLLAMSIYLALLNVILVGDVDLFGSTKRHPC